MKHDFEGVDYAIGLMWSRVGAENYQMELKRLLKEQSMSYGVSKKIPESDHYLVGITDDKASIGAPSASLLLSELETCLILVEKLSDESYWLCVVYNGEVTPGGDCICSKAEVVEKVNSFYSQLSDSDDLVVCIKNSLKKSLGLEVDDSFNLSFLEVLKEHDASAVSAHKVKALVRNDVFLAGVAIVTVAAGLMTFGLINQESEPEYDPWAELESKAPVEVVAKVVAPKPPTQEEVELEKFNKESGGLVSAFSQNNSSHVLSGFLSFFDAYPYQLSGWDVDGMKLDGVNSNMVNVAVRKGSLGTTLTLRSALSGNEESVRISDAGDLAVITYDLSKVSQVEPLASNREKWDTYRDYISKTVYKREQWMHDLDFFGYDWEIRDHKNKDKKLKVNQKNIGERERLVFELKVSGTDEFMLNNLCRMLELGKTTLITSIEIDKNATSWTLTGLIYEK